MVKTTFSDACFETLAMIYIVRHLCPEYVFTITRSIRQCGASGKMDQLPDGHFCPKRLYSYLYLLKRARNKGMDIDGHPMKNSESMGAVIDVACVKIYLIICQERRLGSVCASVFENTVYASLNK